MTYLKYLSFLLLSLGLVACVDDEDMLPALEGIAAPSSLDLNFEIATDNSGAVTIQPLGKGVTLFRVDFGDGDRDTVGMAPGETITHVYERGTYTVQLEAMGVNGATSTYSEELTVEFAAPRSLFATVERVPGNPFAVRVSATADLATGFEIRFGEDDAAEPVRIGIGEVAEYTYGAVGEYEICIIAFNGGNTTVKTTETVVVSDPTVLPINFESRNTEFFAFGNSSVSVVDNPDVSDGNASSRVGEYVKTAGSEVWAGMVVELGAPLDLSTLTSISLKTWSPTAGLPVLMKLENATDTEVFVEVSQNTTVANEWETLVFDFSSLDLSREYAKVVLFFNFGTSGMGEAYYFDDLLQTDGSATIDLPLGFELDAEYVFTGFGGATAGVIANPDRSGANESANVVDFVKASGSMTWGGVFTDVTSPVDFTNGQTIELKVWSPKAGAPILLKFENPDNGDQSIEVSVNTSTANQWEELTYVFPATANLPNQRRVVLFADFGTAGAGQSYYFDDLRVE